MKRKILTELFCCLFIILFLYTGLHKVIDHEVFRVQLLKHPLLRNYASPLSWMVPVSELLIAGLLMLPQCRRGGVWLFMGVMSTFTIYLAYMILLYPHLPCTCGGIVSALSWHQHLAFNLGFIVLAMLVLKWMGVENLSEKLAPAV